MKKGKLILIIASLALIYGSTSCTYYTNPEGPGFVIPPPEPAFIGSEACAGCHQGTYDSFRKSGHPFIHVKVDSGKAPTYPFTSIDFLPPHFSNGWNDVTYVVGGFAWKYHLTDENGFIYTGDDGQYNFQTSEAVPYHPELAPGTKQFDCGKCHTTGWTSVADGGVPQDDLVGMGGSYFAPGVQCEACHGMGSVHASSQSAEDIIVDTEATACGSCHYRTEDNSIAAGDGFILHNAQFDEMTSAGHKELSCVACHNPHVTVKHDQVGGITTQCTECHSGLNNPTHASADCNTCHLPFATKSAVAENKYVGDVMTHIFKINPTEDGEMFNEDGTTANGSTGVTLGYVCYQCHKDEDGVGGPNSTRTLKQLSNRATGFHD